MRLLKKAGNDMMQLGTRSGGPLTVALVCSTDKLDTAAAAFEVEMLRAALATPAAHRFIVYPDTRATRALVRDAGMIERVAFVKAVKKPRLPRRFWRRAKRIVRRRAAPQPFAALNDALVEAGASCAWFLGNAIAPIDLPYVAHIGDLRHRLHPWFPESSSNGPWRERERRHEEFVRRASVLLAGSKPAADAMNAAYGTLAGGAVVLPSPTPAYAIEASWRSRGMRPSDVPSRYLLYVAPFVAHSNHVTAVRVIAALEAGAAPPGLLLVGADEGTMAHVMAEAERLRVAGRVRIFGEVDSDRLVSLYEHAEALLHPSLFDAHDQSPRAAMALGCPVIAARALGTEEQLAGCGTIVEPFDVVGYAAAVRTLRHDPGARTAMVERGMEVAREWSPAQYAAAVLDLIESRIAPMRALWK